jgi:hypothetical protein
VLALEDVLVDPYLDEFPDHVPLQPEEVEVLGMYGLISVLILELVLVDSKVDQFPVQLPLQVELGLIEELAAEVFKVDIEVRAEGDIEESVKEVMVGDDGVVLDVGLGEAVGDPESPVQIPVHEPVHEAFQGPVHGPVHTGLDVFMAEMTLMMLDVIFCTTVTVVTSPSTVVTAVVVAALYSITLFVIVCLG